MITELNHFIMNRLFYKSIESAGNGIFSRLDCLINLIDFLGVFDYIAFAKVQYTFSLLPCEQRWHPPYEHIHDLGQDGLESTALRPTFEQFYPN